MFKLIKNGRLEYYIIEEFERTGLVRHCFTTRAGGVSEGIYKSMNLGVHNGDEPERVRKNHEIICNAIGIDTADLVFSRQVHEDNVLTVTAKDRGNGYTHPNAYKSADGLITNVPHAALRTSYADCVPVMMLDPVTRSVACVHSGWRGTAAGISQKAVHAMEREYGANPADIIVGIGPSIQERNFEVGGDVAEIFRDKYGAQTVHEYGGRQHVNMQRAIELQLRQAGVKQIINCGICTYDEHERLFSHRYTNGKRGNMAAIIELI